MKKIFKISAYIFVFLSTAFIAFNLFISAVLFSFSTNPSFVEQHHGKKILFVVKYVDNKHNKHQQISNILDWFFDCSQIIYSSSYLTECDLPKSVSLLNKVDKDIPIHYCSLLI